MFISLLSFVLAVTNAFFINEMNERFDHTTHAKDAIYTTLEPTFHIYDDEDFYRGFGMRHTPTRHKKTITPSFEEFNIKYFPQYTSTPNWDDYGDFEFTLPPNRSKGEILRAFMKFTVHSFEVEEYFREFDRRTWFSMEDTYEKNAWRGYTSTPFYADLMVYNPNVTWQDPAKIHENERPFEATLDLDYKSDEFFKHMHHQDARPDLYFNETR